MGRLRLVLAVGVLCLAAAQAQAEVSIQGHVGFDGHHRWGQWMPIAVEVNAAGTDARAQLRARLVTSPDSEVNLSRPLHLGERTRQVVHLYGLPSYSGGGVTVNLTGAGSVPPSGMQARMVAPDDTLVGVVGRDRGTLSFLSGSRRHRGSSPNSGTQGALVVADCNPALLPDAWYGYLDLDLLVIGDVPASALRPEVKQAITRWVERGGCLAVTGGSDFVRLRDAFFADLLPVTVAGAESVGSLGDLARRCGGGDPGATMVTRAQPKPGARVLARQGSLPLVVAGYRGLGTVIFVAFDPARPPLRGWPGQNTLWLDCLAEGEQGGSLATRLLESQQPMGHSLDLAMQALQSVPSMRLPSLGWVAAFLGGYVLVLVPLNYGILKRLRRQEWAWVTTPAIVILFTVLAYTIGYAIRGGELLVNQCSLLEMRAGSRTAEVTHLAGVFSPAATRYRVGATDPEAYVYEPARQQGYPRGAYEVTTLTQDESMRYEDIPFYMWAMRMFVSSGSTEVGEGVQADLVLGERKITGTIANRTGFDLRECELVYGAMRRPLGALPAGATRTVALPCNAQPAVLAPASLPANPYGGPYFQGTGNVNAPLAVEQQIGDALRPVLAARGQQALAEPVLLGWGERKCGGVTVDGRQPTGTNLTYVMVHLPLRLAAGRVDIPFGNLPARWQANTSSPIGPGRSAVMMRDGAIVQELRLPFPAPGLRVETLSVRAGCGQTGYTMPQGAPPAPSGTVQVPPGVRFSVYNWRQGAWESVGGVNRTVAVSAPADHVLLPEGLIRLRLTCPPGMSGTLPVSSLDASLSGTCTEP